MTVDISNELDKEHFRESFTKYTVKAFQMLPRLDKPRILDIGCGTGIPTVELARLTAGQIVGLDIDQASLDKFDEKIKLSGLSDRVKTVKCSMSEMNFPDEYFDLIWAEGSIFVIGFERGLRGWRRILKINGFLVVHDEIETLGKSLERLTEFGYVLWGQLELPEDAWWAEYYRPLERRIGQLRTKYRDSPDALKLLDREQRDVDRFKKNPDLHRSAFVIMQKK